MNNFISKKLGLGKYLSLFSVCAFTVTLATASAQPFVYTASNEVTGNLLLRYKVGYQGELVHPERFPTGGVGSGTGLGNQSGIALSKNQQWLAVVNAVSNDVSLFSLYSKDPIFTDKKNTQGIRPVSVTVDNNRLYVVNAGDSSTPSNVVGFRIGIRGSLTIIPESSRLLSAPVSGAAQIAFSPDGTRIAVTEKATNMITVFKVNPDNSLLSEPTSFLSNGQTPFGFEWANKDSIVVSEAFGGNDSAVSQYTVDGSGTVLTSTAKSVDAEDEKAACWVAFTPEKDFAYITNTATNSISSYAHSRKGGLKLIQSRALATKPGPIDFAIHQSGRFGVVLDNSGSLQTFSIDRKTGDLTLRSTRDNIPMSANGLVIQ
jgi:6-phosphogluconolactonase